MIRPLLSALLPAVSLVVFGTSALAELAWPEPAREAKPWTRWWWMGSAVDEGSITRQLEQFAQAGIGGVEICPIYGVKGAEQREVAFLSPEWVQLVAHTSNEAKRLGLGMDLTTGTGWPFGGPNVSEADSSGKVQFARHKLDASRRVNESLSTLTKGKILAVYAVSPLGQHVDITSYLRDGKLGWTAPEDGWQLSIASHVAQIQKVKRPAPGGEGYVLDPYSTASIGRYLGGFDRAFTGYKAPPPRSHFHDSFEYFGANWTPDFFAEFKKRRGYDLQLHLPLLEGGGDPELSLRVKYDYRVTLGELHADYLRAWNTWARSRGSLTRNQAHGSPGNLVDLYAIADIPETESFGQLDEGHLPMLKFASSAAHLAGKKFSSAESCTWLDEHFNTTLAKAKGAVDFLLLSGANHLFFHGIPYSPQDAAWPGWQFYASVNFGPNGGLWTDMPAFTGYIARAQTVLQSGAPDNDVLLYFPLDDLFQSPKLKDELHVPLTIHNVEKVLTPHPYHATAMELWWKGHGYDAISDALLETARVDKGSIAIGVNRWRALVIPECAVLSEKTAVRLAALAKAGAKVIFHGPMPQDVPGLMEVENRRAQLKTALIESSAPFFLASKQATAPNNLLTALAQAGARREPMMDSGLRFVRRRHEEGRSYFIVNSGKDPVSQWIKIGTPTASALLFDPVFADRVGLAPIRHNTEGAEVFLRMMPGETRVLSTYSARNIQLAPWVDYDPAGQPTVIEGTWAVSFRDGGPENPASYDTPTLASWTKRQDAVLNRFAGTGVYKIEFQAPAGEAAMWQLDLGHVGVSARVTLNGKSYGTLWTQPFSINVPLAPGKNVLEVAVTNLAANRIADMDRSKVEWKIFKDINVVNKDYKPLDALTWPLRDSGLIGPVTLQPLKPAAVK